MSLPDAPSATPAPPRGARYSRQRFTNAIVRICERLDGHPVSVFDYQTAQQLWTLQVRGPIKVNS